jgi:hypothetical protein
MEHFKIKIKELIILILLSAPIGVLLYLNNYQKISIEYSFPRGYAYVHNLCNNSTNIYREEILSEGDIQSLRNSHSRDGTSTSIEMPKSNSLYQIKIKGNSDQSGIMHQVIDEIKSELNQLEGSKFKDLLGDIRLHCGSASYRAFKYIPLNTQIIQENIKSRYSFGNLIFILICPFIILYLLIVSKNYIVNK